MPQLLWQQNFYFCFTSSDKNENVHLLAFKTRAQTEMREWIVTLSSLQNYAFKKWGLFSLNAAGLFIYSAGLFYPAPTTFQDCWM